MQLAEAYRRKIQKYAPILSALQYYSQAGWTIEILPWVVGIRGLANTKHLPAALAFLDIPRQKWKDMIEDSVLASVRALAYMHTIRYAGAGRRAAMLLWPSAICRRSAQRTVGSDDDLRLRAWKRRDDDGTS